MCLLSGIYFPPMHDRCIPPCAHDLVITRDACCACDARANAITSQRAITNPARDHWHIIGTYDLLKSDHISNNAGLIPATRLRSCSFSKHSLCCISLQLNTQTLPWRFSITFYFVFIICLRFLVCDC